MEYRKEDLMEAKKQILGVGENMGTEESKKIWEENAQFWDNAMGDESNEFHREVVRPKVMTMLNKKNFLLIPDICDFFVSFGIKKVMFANYICQGKNKDRNSILDKNEVNCALNSIHSMRQKYESSDFYVSRTGAFGFDSMHGCNLCCDAGTEGFVILPNRKVCPCVFLCENNFFIGEYAKGCDFLSCSTFAHDFYSCFALENLNYCTDK